MESILYQRINLLMESKKTKTITYVLEGVMAFATALAIAMVSDYGITGIELMIPCVFVLCFILYNKTVGLFIGEYKSKAFSDLKFTGSLGVIMAIAYVVGSKIDLDERVFSSFGAVDVIYILFLIPFFVSILHIVFFSADEDKLKIKDIDPNDLSSMKIWPKAAVYSLVMLVCWLPYYLTYFPGGIGNDDFECAKMCLGQIPWTNHHPVFFTAILNIFIKLFGGTDLTAAFGVMAFCQMLMLSIVLSLVLLWLEYRHIKRGFIYVSLGFFALHPIVAMYSIYITKDVLFACIGVLLILLLLDICKAIHDNEKHLKRRSVWVILVSLSILTIISRNNGIFMIGALAICMFVLLKQYRKQILIAFVIVFALNGLYKHALWPAMDIEKQSFVESASIPLTQIAYTIYTDGDINADDSEYLESIMPFEDVKKEFTPGYVDTYKFSESFNAEIIDSDPGKLIKTWASLLTDNFGRFVEAYLFETCGYWHYGISNTVATEGGQPNDLGITGIDVIETVSGHSLKGILAKLVLIARKLPVLCLLSQMSVEFLAVILATRQYIRRNKKMYIIAVIPFIALWISIMIATPAYCLFRYMCPVFFLWPVLIEEFSVC